MVVADINVARAGVVAGEVGGVAAAVDVTREGDVAGLVRRTVEAHGAVDIYCSNAGVALGGGAEALDRDWQASWDANVMAHVYSARAVLPSMLSRGEGCLVGTVSAAALLNHVTAAPYAASKAAALSFLEWLSIAYGDRGLRVCAVCPQGVNTPMLARAGDPEFLSAGAIEPDQVARAVIEALRGDAFLVLPHPEVQEYAIRRATDHDRWLRGMRRLRSRATGS